MAFIPRIFIASDDISDDTAYVRGSNFNHIIKVLRKGKGDRVTVCDMHSASYEATITDIGDGCLKLSLGARKHENCEMPFRVTVYQCLPKGEKLDTVVQKAVELGASELVVVSSERCVARPDENAFSRKLERLSRISESAAAQCGRSFVPSVRGMISYAEAIAEILKNDLGFVCYEGDGTEPLRSFLNPGSQNIAFLIGPEGGLTEREVGMARDAGLPLVNLGKRILRTETAALYVLSGISIVME